MVDWKEEAKMSNFTPVEATEIRDNPFSLIGSDWMLVSAGDLGSWNTMTAAWGGFGYLWQRNVIHAYVRPTRYTWEFMEKNPDFTLSFFPETYRDALNYCGSHSGRDVDKAKETGLVPFEPEPGTISFEQARLIIIARTIYHQDIDPVLFIDPSLSRHYPEHDYHRMYIGEVTKCLIRQEL
jgi:flavin reductase (DIM6/NTAB) family NADH-FMN oxidoreductase RutF